MGNLQETGLSPQNPTKNSKANLNYVNTSPFCSIQDFPSSNSLCQHMLYCKQTTSSSLSLSSRYWNYLSLLYGAGSAVPGLGYFIYVFSRFTACSAYLSLKLKYVFFCLSPLPGMFLFLLSPVLCLTLSHRAPQTLLSLSISLLFWLPPVRRLVALLIQLLQ